MSKKLKRLIILLIAYLGAFAIGYASFLLLEDYVSIDVTGNWRATQGILYDKHRTCCAYDEPELLPKGLKNLIYKRAMKMLEA